MTPQPSSLERASLDWRYALVLLPLFAFAGCGYWESSTANTAKFQPTSPSNANTLLPVNATVVGGESRNDEAGSVISKLAERTQQSPIQTRALLAGDCGILALHANERDTARRMLEDATTIVGSISVAGEAEQKATSLHGAESEKNYKGEPHERVAIFFYRGLLFLADGDYENAHACFLNASLQDATSAQAERRGNWMAVDLMLLQCKRLMKDSSAEEFAERCRAKYQKELNGDGRLLQRFDHSVVVVVGVGRGPEKHTTKTQGKAAALGYLLTPSKVAGVQLGCASRAVPLTPCDDVYVQVVTRGQRAMDDVLAAKANTKQGIENAGVGINVVAQAGASVVPGLGLLGMFAMDASLAEANKVNASADIRQLYSLPGKVYVGIYDRAELDDAVMLRTIGTEGRVIGEQQVKLGPAKSNGPVVVVGLAPY